LTDVFISGGRAVSVISYMKSFVTSAENWT